MALIKLTPELCNAAGADAANAQMRKRGDTAWNEDDYNLACETSNRLKEIAGFIPRVKERSN